MVDIQVDYDKVTIEGHVIARPARIGVVQWFDFWEEYTNGDTAYQHGYREGYRRASNHNASY